ncbi:MAG: DUF2628 domain-containing protein [Oscillospiraceae bacterium]|nr:DUF2628 domain-containing protein [Oscillospiraceae bacterium]
MPIYVGQPCSSCGRILTKTDDIVVCPECGSPYHRDCYISEGRCTNTHLHETGESWQPTVDNSQAENKKIICPNCGAENEFGATFCCNCGAPVNMEKVSGGYQGANTGNNQNPYGNGRYQNGGYQNGNYQNQNNNYQNQNGYGRPYGNPYMGGMRGGFPFYGNGAYSADYAIGNHTVAEYSDYVGSNSPYFIPKFVRFENGKKWSFNFSAFFFPHIYFFYRKMIREGAVMLLLTALFSIPTLIYYMYAYGIIGEAIVSTTSFAVIYNVCSIFSYVLSIFAGLFANYIYYRKAKSDLDSIKNGVVEYNSQREALMTKGGTSMAYAVGSVVALTVIFFAIMIIVVMVASGESTV